MTICTSKMGNGERGELYQLYQLYRSRTVHVLLISLRIFDLFRHRILYSVAYTSFCVCCFPFCGIIFAS